MTATDTMTTDDCWACERPVTISNTHWAVHITTTNEVVAEDYAGDDSQGCFPIGVSCRKRYPLAFRAQFADA